MQDPAIEARQVRGKICWREDEMYRRNEDIKQQPRRNEGERQQQPPQQQPASVSIGEKGEGKAETRKRGTKGII